MKEREGKDGKEKKKEMGGRLGKKKKMWRKKRNCLPCAQEENKFFEP